MYYSRVTILLSWKHYAALHLQRRSVLRTLHEHLRFHQPVTLLPNAVLTIFQNPISPNEISSNPSQKPKLHLTPMCLMLLKFLILVCETAGVTWLTMIYVMRMRNAD